jgi:hypothetical protein
LAYGPAGWLAIAGHLAWVSVDGRSWSGPSSIGLDEIGPSFELESSDAGYVAFDRHRDLLLGSVDGVDWTSVDHGGVRVSDAELIGDKLLVVLVDGEGVTTVRRGTLGAGGAVSWDTPAADIGGAGFHVDRITQSPDSVLAVGWDEEAPVPALWRSTNGTTWTRLAAEHGPDGVGLFEPVWGAAGWVGPGLERSTDGGEWFASDYSLAYDGPVPPCPPAEKVSVIVLAYLGRFAEGCFGDTSVTIRGYVPMFEGFGGIYPITGESWLAAHFPYGVLAAGFLAEPGGYQLGVFVPPDVDGSLFNERELWLEVVGHYRDAASADCRYRPRTDMPSFLISLDGAEATCSERFVVESVIQVEGP